MICAPIRSIIPSLKLGDYLRTGAQTMLYLSLVIVSTEKGSRSLTRCGSKNTPSSKANTYFYYVLYESLTYILIRM